MKSKADKLTMQFQSEELKQEFLDLAIARLAKVDDTSPTAYEVLSFFKTGKPVLVPRGNLTHP